MRCNKLFSTSCAILLFLLCAQVSKSQDKLELGLFAGASYYLGDLNPTQQFKAAHPAIGGVARYIFTDRLALRANVIVANLSGEYPSGGDKYLNWEGVTQVATNENGDIITIADNKYSFERTIVDVAIMGEFNFMSYDHNFRKDSRFTPYLALGVGVAGYKQYTDKSSGETVFVLSLPFGLGAKYKVNKWLRVGVEWTFRKTFVDDLDVVASTDGKVDPADTYGFDHNTFTHNNDWYSFAGVTVTMSMWPRVLKCNDGVRNFNR